MTYIVSSGALNSTHSLTQLVNCAPLTIVMMTFNRGKTAE